MQLNQHKPANPSVLRAIGLTCLCAIALVCPTTNADVNKAVVLVDGELDHEAYVDLRVPFDKGPQSQMSPAKFEGADMNWFWYVLIADTDADGKRDDVVVRARHKVNPHAGEILPTQNMVLTFANFKGGEDDDDEDIHVGAVVPKHKDQLQVSLRLLGDGTTIRVSILLNHVPEAVPPYYPGQLGPDPDCNANGKPDDEDIEDGTSQDEDGDGIPDECGTPCPDDINENFDAYPEGSLAGQGDWRAWDDNPEASDFLVTSDKFLSQPHSLEIDGLDDAVNQYCGPAFGQWTCTAHVYVPEEMDDVSYFILLNTYIADEEYPEHWSLQLELDGMAGVIADRNGQAELPLIKGQWTEIRVEIDLDLDEQSVFYNGGHMLTKSWTAGVAEGGSASIAAVDLFANGSSSVYYDDLALASSAQCPADITSDGVVDVLDLLQVLSQWGTSGSADITGDGIVDVLDLLEVLAAWGPC